MKGEEVKNGVAFGKRHEGWDCAFIANFTSDAVFRLIYENSTIVYIR
jgi:hypothetical protein